MKKGVLSAALALFLTAAVLVLPIVNAQYTSSQEPKPDRVNKSHEVIVDKEKNENSDSNLTNNETDSVATFIVTVDGDSLLDTFISSDSGYGNIVDFIKSSDGRQYNDSIKKNQAVVKASIRKIVPKSDFSDSFTYAVVLNGFSVKAPKSSLEKIRGIKGVRSVIICNDIQYVNDETNETSYTDDISEMNGSEEENTSDENGTDTEQRATFSNLSKNFKDTVNADYAYKRGYTGGKSLVAVIDDEFDCSHSVFSALPAEPKYTESELGEIFSSVKFNTASEYSFKDVYKSGKIIFAYDYADKDNETYSGGDSHGTHIAGIIAGNNGKTGVNEFSGIAYDSQLAFMKVSYDSESVNGKITSADAVLAAFDDSVKLGADVINCSFGAARNMYEYSLYKDIVEKLTAAGTVVVTSAGNYCFNGSEINDSLSALYTDYNTISGFGMIDGCFTAASVDNNSRIGNKLKIGEDEITYFESQIISEETNYVEDDCIFNVKIKNGTEYYCLDSQGAEEDYDDKNVFGKVVVLSEGEISPEQQADNAYKMGALGVILISDSENLSLTSKPIPFIRVPSDYEEFFYENPEGKLSVDNADYIYRTSGGVDMSEKSSYGVTPDLKLKPDISAPGVNVLSSVDNDKYGIMSGTSMAAPCAAGAYLLVKQYLETMPNFSQLTQMQKNETVKAVMMSNADAVKYNGDSSDNDVINEEGSEDNNENSNENNNGEAVINTEPYCSPRVSGAGLLNLGRSMSSGAYITVGDTMQAKANLGDNISGKYEFEAVIHNMSGSARKYNVSAWLGTDSFSVNEDMRCINTLAPYSLGEGAKVVISVNGKNTDTVSVAAKSEQRLKISITLDPVTVLAYKNFFKNGFFTDGYIFLDGNDGTRLNIPIMGFCGDWSETEIFDKTIYDGNGSVTGFENSLNAVAGMDYSAEDYTLGLNKFTGEANTQNISIGKDTVRNINEDRSLDDSYILPCFYMLRDAYDFTVTVSSNDGKTLFTHNYGTVGSFYSKDTKPYYALTDYSGDLKKFFSSLSEGKYVYTVSAKTMDSDGALTSEKSESFNFTVDNTPPEDISHKTYLKDGKIYLELTAKDETALQGFRFYTASYNAETGKYDYADQFDKLTEAGYLPENSYKTEKISYNDDGSVTFLYDITELRSRLGRLSLYSPSNMSSPYPLKIVYKAVDYAFNMSNARTVDTIVYGSAEFTFVDRNNRPVKGVKAAADGKEIISDENGVIKFDGLLSNVYEVDIVDIPENYTLKNKIYIIGIIDSRMDYKKKILLDFSDKYVEPSDVSQDLPETVHSESSVTSAEINPQNMNKTDKVPKDTGGNSYYALAFVGVILLISVGALLFSKYRRNI